MQQRRSSIWKLDKELLRELVKSCITYTEVLSYFNLQNKGSNFKTLKKRLVEEQIDTSHFKRGANLASLRRVAKPLNEILVVSSSYNRTK